MDNPNVRPQINPEDTETLFFNVLPKNKSVGSVKTNTGDVPSIASEKTPNKFWLAISKYKWFLIGGIAIAILAVIAYVAVQIIVKPKPVDTTLVPFTNNNSQPTNADKPPADSITPEWRKQFFGNEVCSEQTICGENADPDHDGLTNLEEFTNKTDPNNSDSDSDGLADGDEVHVFDTDPTKLRTNQNFTFNDADYAKGGFDITTNTKLTNAQLQEIKSKIKQFGLHQPTITTLGDAALQMYDFVNPDTGPSLKNVDMQPQAKLDRDTQRLATIRKIGIALLKYQVDFKTFPATSDFNEMVSRIKAYTTVATNFSDPINQDKYVYTYQSQNKDTDFVMTYYSETQSQVIKYTAADAQKDALQDAANINDDQRVRDLETIKQALLIYSSGKTDSNSSVQFVFPAADQYKTELVPKYLATLPVDPKTKKDYAYTVSDKFDSFTLKAILENPPKGTTGYLCNQEECRNY